MTLLSVLVPTFNRSQQLREALLSIALNLGPDLEIIIGNNGVVAPVRDLLAELSLPFDIRLIENPEGSTYPYSLGVLVASATGKWLTILHDDDFFLPSVSSVIPVLSASEDIDFLFSDHSIADISGQIMEEQSSQNTFRYRRSNLQSGRVENLQLLAVEQTICFSCFFVRSHLAQSCFIDTGLKCFADVLFLQQVAALVQNPMYNSGRLFAYRINEGATSQGLVHDELLFVLRRCLAHVSDPEAIKILKRRIRSQTWQALKYCIKKRKPKSLLIVLPFFPCFN